MGLWLDMLKLSGELQRVGVSGWVQVPAYEFFIEPHFKLPFVHWFGQPTRARLLRLFGGGRYRCLSPADLRMLVEGVNLLSKREFLPFSRRGNIMPSGSSSRNRIS